MQGGHGSITSVSVLLTESALSVMKKAIFAKDPDMFSELSEIGLLSL